MSAGGAFVLGAVLVFLLMRRGSGFRFEYRVLRFTSDKEMPMSTIEPPEEPGRPSPAAPPPNEPPPVEPDEPDEPDDQGMEP